MSDLTFTNATTMPVMSSMMPGDMMLPTQLGPFQVQQQQSSYPEFDFEATLAPSPTSSPTPLSSEPPKNPKKKKSLKSQLMSTPVVCSAPPTTTTSTSSSSASGGLPVPPGAMVFEKLSDFRGYDNSLVFPRKAAPEIDNITQVGTGHFRFELRMRGNPWSPLNPKGTRGAWYDGDRDLEWNEGKRDKRYHDKSRAEVNWELEKSKFKVTMKNNETWDMGTTVKLDANFVPSRMYCNIMQPVFDQSFLSLTGINGDDVSATLFVFSNGIGSKILSARTFTIKRGVWTSIIVRMKFGKDGRYEVSLNGDPFKGIGLDTGKLFEKRGVGCKLGIYATATTNVQGKPMKDLIVEHKNIYMRKVA